MIERDFPVHVVRTKLLQTFSSSELHSGVPYTSALFEEKENPFHITEFFVFSTYTCCYFRTFIPDHRNTFTRQTGRDVRTGVGGTLNLVGVRGGEERETGQQSLWWPWFCPVTSWVTTARGAVRPTRVFPISDFSVLRHRRIHMYTRTRPRAHPQLHAWFALTPRRRHHRDTLTFPTWRHSLRITCSSISAF